MEENIKKRPLKRFLDILAAVFFLILFLPLFILVAILLKIEGLRDPEFKDTVFFKETRVSKGKPYLIYKFRTVKKSTLGLIKKEEKTITAFTSIPDKGRFLTPVGVFLANTYLDELPQFINVLKGDMSIVGPRPHPPDHYKIDLKNGAVSAK